MLEKLVKEYGITKIAAELNLTELSVRYKISGKKRLFADEWHILQTLLNLTNDQIEHIEYELNIRRK